MASAKKVDFSQQAKYYQNYSIPFRKRRWLQNLSKILWLKPNQKSYMRQYWLFPKHWLDSSQGFKHSPTSLHLYPSSQPKKVELDVSEKNGNDKKQHALSNDFH